MSLRGVQDQATLKLVLGSIVLRFHMTPRACRRLSNQWVTMDAISFRRPIPSCRSSMMEDMAPRFMKCEETRKDGKDGLKEWTTEMRKGGEKTRKGGKEELGEKEWRKGGHQESMEGGEVERGRGLEERKKGGKEDRRKGGKEEMGKEGNEEGRKRGKEESRKGGTKGRREEGTKDRGRKGK